MCSYSLTLLSTVFCVYRSLSVVDPSSRARILFIWLVLVVSFSFSSSTD